MIRDNWIALLTAAVLMISCSGCFIANAKKRDRDREIASTNLPPMEVTTNLFRPTIPEFR